MNFKMLSNQHLNSTQTFIGIKISHFKNKVTIDPDFFILLDSQSTSGDSSICTSNISSATKIAGIVIGSVVFTSIIIISIVYFIFQKKRNAKKFQKQVQTKLKQFN
ncbi:hypothetical protein ACTA71_000078 [Dictyostelium dimigraforme]